MKKVLSNLWSSRDFSNGPAPPHVSFGGEDVWAIYDVELSDGDRLRFHFEVVEDEKAAQGLEVKVENGALFGDGQVHDELLKRIRLWSDTMPTPVVEHTVVAHRPGDQVFVRVWHVWRRHENERGADAWVGAYGFRVEKHGRDLTLRCNAGYSEPDFDDLVVRLSVNPEGREREDRIAELREKEALLLSCSGKRRRGSAKRNWKTMSEEKLRAAIAELQRGRGSAYETCVMAGGDPENELNRALSAAAERGITL